MPSGVAIKVKKAIRIEGNILLMDEDGKLYSPRVRDKHEVYAYSLWNFTRPFLLGMARLGLITRKEAEEHLKQVQQQAYLGERQRTVSQLVALSRKMELCFSLKQRALMKRYAKGR